MRTVTIYNPNEANSQRQSLISSATSNTPRRWLQAEAYEAATLPRQLPDEHHHDQGHDHHHDVNRHDERVRASCFTIDQPIQAERLDAALEILLRLAGEDLLRVKGILNVQGMDKPLVIRGRFSARTLPQRFPRGSSRYPASERSSGIFYYPEQEITVSGSFDIRLDR